MVPILSLVGRSGAGKTTFLTRLIPELRQRGYRVGCIKHTLHAFEVDQPGKDSWQLAKAGGGWVAIANHEQLAIMARVATPPTLDMLAEQFGEHVDIIITEGYRNEGKPCIEIMRSAHSTTPLARLEDLMALITDAAVAAPCPIFKLHDVVGVADFIEQHFLNRGAVL